MITRAISNETDDDSSVNYAFTDGGLSSVDGTDVPLARAESCGSGESIGSWTGSAEGVDDAPGPSVGLVGVSEDSVSNLATTYMGRVWGYITRAEIVGVRDGNVGAVSRATGLQFRRAVERFLQRKADRWHANVLLRGMMVAWGRHAGVFPPPLVSDDSSDEEVPFGLASAYSTDSDDE